LPNATHDVAIVYAPSGTYVLAVLSDLPWTSAPILAVSRAVYTYYNGDNEDASRRLALRKIVRRPGTSALVDSEGRLLGLLSERDLLAWASSGGKELMAGQELARRAEQDSVASLVSEETVTLDDSAPISAGIRAILEQQVDSLPVVKDGKVAGVVSSHDLLATLFEDEARAERPGGLDSFPVAAREEQHRLAGSLNGANGER